MARSRGTRLALAALLAALAASLLPGCGPRYARTTVWNEGGVTVSLRKQTVGGEPVERGFAQPAAISAVRLTNVLSRIDLRLLEGDGERIPGIPTESLFDIGRGLSHALAKAGPDDEVVVQSTVVRRNLRVFTNRFFTGLVVWVRGDELIVHVTHHDQRVERDDRERLPEPRADRASQRFKVIAGPSMVIVGPNALSVAWRDPVFKTGGNVRVDAFGRAARRTILMEEEQPAEPESASGLPADLSPEALRELADLEEERRSGGISEAEYQARRRAILGGGGTQP